MSVPCLPVIDELKIELKEYKDEKIEWIPRETCIISTAKQGSQLWHRLRLFSISMSTIGYNIGRCPPAWSVSKEEAALQICGLSSKKFTDEALKRMKIGSDGEPYLRKWHSEQIKKPIYEVGVAIWKKDVRFRGSVDGDLDDGTFAEYKIPEKMYRALIEYVEATKKGFTRPPSDYSHIFSSHYDQMTGNGVIMNKTACRYTVMSWSTGMVYQQTVPVDHEHWDNVLYPQSCTFYDTYITPIMKKYKFQRIDPPI